MLLEHKIKIYDALQNLPTVDENKHYGDLFFAHEVNAEDVPNTPKKKHQGINFGCCEAGKLFERKILLVEQCIKINIPINTYTLYSIWITSRWDKL